jgi:hypothetical protein
MMAMWWLINFASCVKSMTWVRSLIIVKKFNKGITRMVTSMDWCGLGEDIRFRCNTFICDLIVEIFIGLQKRNLI